MPDGNRLIKMIDDSTDGLVVIVITCEKRKPSCKVMPSEKERNKDKENVVLIIIYYIMPEFLSPKEDR